MKNIPEQHKATLKSINPNDFQAAFNDVGGQIAKLSEVQNALPGGIAPISEEQAGKILSEMQDALKTIKPTVPGTSDGPAPTPGADSSKNRGLAK